MTKGQRKLVTFALKYADKWHGYSTDYHTINLICATANLGIIEVNDYDQFRLKSKDKAERFLT